ncbi:MAG: class III poly(R)-hydroxyalkanoic acid synthase subunit PhaC [Proteobacteria bacterium]|nr:class III poly(R)-hydroxyalkanoic acid synthase subunit PhaC [Pseudomonadota bacterium]
MLPNEHPLNKLFSESMSSTKKALGFSLDSLQTMLGSLDTKIASTPSETVYTEDRIKLKHYVSENKEKKGTKAPLLIVYALINRETMLDIQPERSVIRSFLKEGMDVYILEWGYPSWKDRFLTIDDHVSGYMNNVVDYILESRQLQSLNLMGICMGGTFSLMYASLYPDKVRNLITTVTPSSFDTQDGLLHVWMNEINADSVTDGFGNIPGDLMNFGFLLMNPPRLMVDKYKNLFENLDDKAFVENFIRMEKWIFDSPDLPGETFRQFITDCYQKNLFIQSKMDIGGKRIDLSNVTMPLLNIYAKYDHLVPPAAANKITAAVGSTDVQDICLDTGHIGIYVSSKCQGAFAPAIASWLKQRDPSGKPVLKEVKKSPKTGRKHEGKRQEHPGRAREMKTA